MSKGRKRRNCARWARYFNHYSWIPGVTIGGWGAFRAMNFGPAGSTWTRIRRQRPKSYGAGYKEEATK